MLSQIITQAQKAELQQSVWATVERFRQRHGVSSGAVFEFLVAFAWGYARRGGESNEAIANRMRARCDACELAHQQTSSHQLALRGLGRG